MYLVGLLDGMLNYYNFLRPCGAMKRHFKIPILLRNFISGHTAQREKQNMEKHVQRCSLQRLLLLEKTRGNIKG